VQVGKMFRSCQFQPRACKGSFRDYEPNVVPACATRMLLGRPFMRSDGGPDKTIRKSSAKLKVEHVPPPVPEPDPKPVLVLEVPPPKAPVPEVPVPAPPNGDAVEPKPR